MSRKRKDVDWAPPVKPDIRQVLANLTVKAPSPPDGSATGDEEPPGAPKRRPALRLVRPKKER
ncbi:MAG: hypothetical protein LBE01_06610 [Deltaproteobacteria bacterium]|jgi:hypothetical protein|nr:hypothetical protein [Deltaproteobacteria bacterium]